MQDLFRARAERYRQRPLFKYVTQEQEITVSWEQTLQAISQLAEIIVAHLHPGKRVAIYAPNSLDYALIDISCLTHGIELVPIATNCVPEHLEYIINTSNIGVIFIASSELLRQFLNISVRAPGVDSIFTLDDSASGYGEKLQSLTAAKDALRFRKKLPAHHWPTITAQQPASIMYTSGTTGLPKGIVFTNFHVIFKRYCRAFALPQLGSDDCFLCYLPFFHTFGRWFELWGCIFWGACYCFAENPSIATLIDNFKRFQPTAFISIPKKWLQIYERAVKAPLSESPELQGKDKKLHQLTGGRLRWGLSAAGYMDPEIFQFFQEHGIDLVSGYGLTEATGGVTMTPPGGYVQESVGLALPGIEIKRAQDGELCLRGGYVADGYFPSGDRPATDAEGWFHTGDIVTIDAKGHLYIVDRKKDIYKNLRGQTIAPQKIESMFEDFPEIKRGFLVGDGKEYNTLLLYPDPQLRQNELATMAAEAVKDYFQSLVVSVNHFLAPYERIYDFAIIDRDFSEEYGEITAKNTRKRKTIERNFAATIAALYQRSALIFNVGEVELQIPHWLLRRLGVIESDISYNDGRLVSKTRQRSLTIRSSDDTDSTLVTIGNMQYRCHDRCLHLGGILRDPSLWIGNIELIAFTGEEATVISRRTPDAEERPLALVRILPATKLETLVERLGKAISDGERSLYALHVASGMLFGEDPQLAQEALYYLESLFQDSSSEWANLICSRLQLTAYHRDQQLHGQALRILTTVSDYDWQREIWQTFIAATPVDFSDELAQIICRQKLDATVLAGLFAALADYRQRWATLSSRCQAQIDALLRLLVAYASAHPSQYKPIREELARWLSLDDELARYAQGYIEEICQSLRQWLGANPGIAIDKDTQEEYSWNQVVIFDEGLDPEQRQCMQQLFHETIMVKEALFVLADNLVVQLDDFAPGSIWVSLLESKYGMAVYRVAVRTRQDGYHNFILYVNRTLEPDKFAQAAHWMIWVGTWPQQLRILPELGGYWPDYQIISAEYLAGDSVSKWLDNLELIDDAAYNERLYRMWPVIVWWALEIYVEFWQRTGRRWLPSEPSPQNIVIPRHDYHQGARIKNISERQPVSDAWEIILCFRQRFVERVAFHYPVFKNLNDERLLFHPFLEVLGEEQGLEVLQQALRQAKKFGRFSELGQELQRYIEDTWRQGFCPRRYYSAVARYRRWRQHNHDATMTAMLQTLEDCYQTYRLVELEAQYPEIRLRYFVDTVLSACTESVAEKLAQLIQDLRYRLLGRETLLERLSSLALTTTISEPERFFLTRIGYARIDYSARVQLIELAEREGGRAALMVVKSGKDGRNYTVRPPKTPKEAGKLHRIFVQANLPVHFSQEHRLLLLLNDNNLVLGGLFFRRIDAQVVHLEKIIVDRRYRGLCLGEILLNVFCELAQSEGFAAITTQFFGWRYFKRFGFDLDKRYGGLVKKLRQPPETKLIDEDQIRLMFYQGLM